MQIKKEEASYYETPIEISGSENVIEKAMELIEAVINPSVSSITSRMEGTLRCKLLGHTTQRYIPGLLY